MKLTEEEQAEVNRQFAAHFGVELPKEINITIKLTHSLYRREGGSTVNESFATLFGCKFAGSEREAIHLCNEWADKFTILLHKLDMKRAGREQDRA